MKHTNPFVMKLSVEFKMKQKGKTVFSSAVVMVDNSTPDHLVRDAVYEKLFLKEPYGYGFRIINMEKLKAGGEQRYSKALKKNQKRKKEVKKGLSLNVTYTFVRPNSKLNQPVYSKGTSPIFVACDEGDPINDRMVKEATLTKYPYLLNVVIDKWEAINET